MKMLNTADKKMTAMRNHSTIHYTAYQIAKSINRGQATIDRIETVLTQIHSETGLRNFAKIDTPVIEQYITYLYERVENEELSRITTASYLSALNTALVYAEKGDLAVSGKSVGLSRGSFTPTDRSVSSDAHNAFLEHLKLHPDAKSAALEHSIQLQREFGLRARESFAIKKETIKNALSTGVLRLTKADLPKNSRPRSITISHDQKHLLQETLSFMQEHNYHSLIPPSETLREHSSWAYHEVEKFRKVAGELGENYHFHGNRHFYAQSRYSSLWEEKAGVRIEAPVKASGNWQEYASSKTGLLSQKIKEIDKEIRLVVSAELGHNRLSVTRAYLG